MKLSTIPSKRITYLVINLTEEIWTLKTIQFCAHVLKQSIFLNVHTSQGNTQIQYKPYQKSNDILHRNRIIILKVIWNHEKTWIAKAFEKKKFGGVIPTDFRLCYRAIKTVLYFHKKYTHRTIEQNRAARNNPSSYS